MTRATRAFVVLVGVIVLTPIGGPSALTLAGGGSGDHGTGAGAADALARASAVALAATGGGRGTATEVGDEESVYEVEVTLDDGRQVDVQVDGDFGLVKRSGDAERREDGPAGG